ncbi:MAG: acetylxylan esterase [Kiritimatiellae bacterium]|nr:acetylxylan esterase [Kiritimatiellia bacterium]
MRLNHVQVLFGSLLLMTAAARAEEPFGVPPLLVAADGRRIETAEAWEKFRRPEILDLFQKEVYGRRPVERPAKLTFSPAAPDKPFPDLKATRKLIDIRYEGPGGKGTIRVNAFIPTQEKPAPGFVLICNRPAAENIDPERKVKSPFWPVEEIVARGYAAIAFFNGDVAPDRYNGFTNGVHAVFQPAAERNAESWGTLSAWAWGASRVMDWIETEPTLDKGHIAVIGHSRGGKTALWCGATDPRFALTISNDSGCGGAKLNRMELPKSESIARITKTFPHWFCKNFDAYAGREKELPLDMHQLVALMAPRLVYVASASKDDWAGQPGEFQSALLASPAWALYGKKGLVGTAFPPPDTPLQEGCVGYHLRTGPHNLTPYDWNRYMDFTDRHGWRR